MPATSLIKTSEVKNTSRSMEVGGGDYGVNVDRRRGRPA